jgi:hypothetical protein
MRSGHFQRVTPRRFRTVIEFQHFDDGGGRTIFPPEVSRSANRFGLLNSTAVG